MNFNNLDLKHSVNFLEVKQTALLDVKATSAQNAVGSVRSKPEISIDQHRRADDWVSGKWENENYKITFNEQHAKIMITNKETNEVHDIQGGHGVGYMQSSLRDEEGYRRTFNPMTIYADMRITLDDGTIVNLKKTQSDNADDNGVMNQIVIQDGMSNHVTKISGLEKSTSGNVEIEEMTELQLSEADRISPREGVHFIEDTDNRDAAFALDNGRGSIDRLEGDVNADRKMVNARVKMLRDQGIQHGSELDANQQAISNQIDQFIQMSLQAFASPFQMPTGMSAFEQISTMIQGQTHTFGRYS